ncbi:carbohydrate ABC transporter permease [Cohnella silvisoli]|uniref:Sugar ABC transporter permease n=1 Tax=Cohnella silvisoli TaxID=2873699 RepID=A0ABV1KUA1_9BACL|nr:sugar ABC transporter permease [Cohnella silvisoli]MCD9021393.1 sugar ABC transporter permease [Cohnella silvisoli]
MRTKTNKYLRQEMTAWFMSAPALIILLLFMIVPLLMSVYFSFTNRMLIMPPHLSTKFLGLENYRRILEQNDFFIALMNTLKFALVVVPVQTTLALLLALLINSKLRFIYFFRTVFFSPVVITMVVVSIIWSLLLAPGPEGFINSFLSHITFGAFEPKAWLFDKHSSLYAIMMFSIWQGVGFQMIIFLAGLQYISKDLYEASGLDGASKIQQFFYVTLPQLRNTSVFIMITTTIFAFKLFTQVLVLTNGGPQDSTLTLVYLLYSEGFTKMKIGYSSAIGVLFFLIVLLISIVQMKLTKVNREG